eukprot:scaffold425921_cov71-Attheya_sp.AAC.2
MEDVPDEPHDMERRSHANAKEPDRAAGGGNSAQDEGAFSRHGRHEISWNSAAHPTNSTTTALLLLLQIWALEPSVFQTNHHQQQHSPQTIRPFVEKSMVWTV